MKLKKKGGRIEKVGFGVSGFLMASVFSVKQVFS